MKVLAILGLVALASGAPRVSKILAPGRPTPLSRGGGRIVGGEDAYYGEFPHQITLLRGGVDGSLMCGGSLVSANWVVTAAHCCDGQSASRLGVAVGSHNLYSDDADQENIAVKRIVMHEDYSSWTVENDICLLELEHSATMGSHVGTISLPSQYEEKDDVPVVSDANCRDSYGQSDIADSMICAGFDRGGKDSCQGDSGGPFMCGSQLSGVVSWGYGCAEAGYPGVYTQTS